MPHPSCGCGVENTERAWNTGVAGKKGPGLSDIQLGCRPERSKWLQANLSPVSQSSELPRKELSRTALSTLRSFSRPSRLAETRAFLLLAFISACEIKPVRNKHSSCRASEHLLLQADAKKQRPEARAKQNERRTWQQMQSLALKTAPHANGAGNSAVLSIFKLNSSAE